MLFYWGGTNIEYMVKTGLCCVDMSDLICLNAFTCGKHSKSPTKLVSKHQMNF